MVFSGNKKNSTKQKQIMIIIGEISFCGTSLWTRNIIIDSIMSINLNECHKTQYYQPFDCKTLKQSTHSSSAIKYTNDWRKQFQIQDN